MLKIELNYRITDREGKETKLRVPQLDEEQNQVCDNFGNPLFKDGKYFTMREIIEEVCVNPIPAINKQTGQPNPIPDEDKKQLFRLFHRVQGSDSLLSIESEERDFLKKYITRRYNSPLTVGQAFEVMDPGCWKKEKKEKEEQPK